MSLANDPNVVTGLTAATTQTQAGALASTAGSGAVLKGRVNVIGTCANSADAVILPTNAQKGAEIFVRNLGAAPAAVFPPVGGAVNGGTVNIAFSVTNAKGGWFHCTSVDGLTWTATLSA